MNPAASPVGGAQAAARLHSPTKPPGAPGRGEPPRKRREPRPEVIPGVGATEHPSHPEAPCSPPGQAPDAGGTGRLPSDQPPATRPWSKPMAPLEAESEQRTPCRSCRGRCSTSGLRLKGKSATVSPPSPSHRLLYGQGRSWKLSPRGSTATPRLRSQLHRPQATHHPLPGIWVIPETG